MRLIILSSLLFIPLFIFRYSTSQPHFSIGDKVRITARLTQQPLIINNKQLINISKLRVFVPRFPEINYGDKVVIIGIVKQEERGWSLDDPELKMVEKHGLLPEIRTQLINLVHTALPEPESALVSGITLGAKEGLPTEFFNSLKNSGTLHVVVASGMNITLLAGLLMNVLVVFFTRRLAIPLALGGIWAYVFLIGPEAPIIRAAVMGSLAFTGQALGRVYLAWWGLLLSAAVMLLVTPSWITDTGFLLSFAATAGILAFERPIKNWIHLRVKFIPRLINEDFSTSLAAQIGATPILFVAFGQFTPWSPFVNALLLWTIAPMMVLGFWGGLIGLLIEPLGKFLILLAYPLAFFFVKIVSLF